jgi:hypothetical protein
VRLRVRAPWVEFGTEESRQTGAGASDAERESKMSARGRAKTAQANGIESHRLGLSLDK